jgi:hypothetical protein
MILLFASLKWFDKKVFLFCFFLLDGIVYSDLSYWQVPGCMGLAINGINHLLFADLRCGTPGKYGTGFNP